MEAVTEIASNTNAVMVTEAAEAAGLSDELIFISIIVIIVLAVFLYRKYK